METQFETLKEYAKPGLVPDRCKVFAKVLAISVSLASIPSFISVVVFLETLPTDLSPGQTLLFWNIYVASLLGRAGFLPTCENCELMSLLVVLFDGFIVGVVGYAIVICVIATVASLRSDEKHNKLV